MSKVTNNIVINYFREAKEEMKKVTWPSQKETIRYSAIVIVVSVAAAAYFMFADVLIGLGLDALLQITQ
ncbi:MAG: preprotein translocase subunit SecE [Patescibacteria group bacterium]